MATKKTAHKTTAKKTARTKAPSSMPKAGKNAKGGLTEAGRRYFAQKEGSHLKPGVTGAADTPEKMRRKGSFLRRHFARPRGPMIDDQGQPTRLALSAHAWGEPVPKTMAAAKKLADKGHKLLEQYQSAKARTAKGKTSGKSATKATTKKVAAKKRPAEGAAARTAKA